MKTVRQLPEPPGDGRLLALGLFPSEPHDFEDKDPVLCMEEIGSVGQHTQAEIAREMRRRMERLTEYSIWELMRNGLKVTVEGEDLYDIPPMLAHAQRITAAVPWTDEANADPLQDLTTSAEKVNPDGKLRVYVYMSSPTYNLMWRTARVKELGPGRSMPTPRDLDSFLRPTIAHIYQYDAGWRDDDGITQYLPQGDVFIMPEREWGVGDERQTLGEIHDGKLKINNGDATQHGPVYELLEHDERKFVRCGAHRMLHLNHAELIYYLRVV